MPSVVGDLGLGEVEVVAERQHLALAVGQGAERGEHAVVVARVGRASGASDGDATARRWRRSTPRWRRCDGRR